MQPYLEGEDGGVRRLQAVVAETEEKAAGAMAHGPAIHRAIHDDGLREVRLGRLRAGRAEIGAKP